MKPSLGRLTRHVIRVRNRQQANARAVLLVVAGLAAGFVSGVFWSYQVHRQRSATASETGIELSEGTKAILRHLDSPVEIRFYALLNEPKTNSELQTFAARVDQMLSAFEHMVEGKVTVVRHFSPTEDEKKAAAADGLRPFTLDGTETCYLGLAVSQAAQRETLSHITPEWEPALEFDLIRAIDKIAAAQRLAAQVELSSQTDKAAVEAMRRSLPNAETVSAEEGAQILREAGLKEFKDAAAELEAKVKVAEERSARAQSGGTQAEQESARQDLLKLHAEQAARFKEIAGRYQAQIGALERLKGAVQPPQSPAPTNSVLPSRR